MSKSDQVWLNGLEAAINGVEAVIVPTLIILKQRALTYIFGLAPTPQQSRNGQRCVHCALLAAWTAFLRGAFPGLAVSGLESWDMKILGSQNVDAAFTSCCCGGWLALELLSAPALQHCILPRIGAAPRHRDF